MNTIGKQMQEIIQNNIPTNIKVKLPTQQYDSEQGMLKEILETERITQIEIEKIRNLIQDIWNTTNNSKNKYDYYNVPKGYNYYNS